MKRLLALALVLALLAPAVAAQTSAGFTGKWEGTMRLQAPDGTESEPRPVLFDLTQDSKELKGTAGPPDQQLPIQKGVVADGKASFQVQSTRRLYSFTLTIVDGRLKGEMTTELEGSVGRAKVDAAKTK
jgi:hypothetical protein